MDVTPEIAALEEEIARLRQLLLDHQINPGAKRQLQDIVVHQLGLEVARLRGLAYLNRVNPDQKH